jgi:glycosyltransferase involved in cell wall biosynthesis
VNTNQAPTVAILMGVHNGSEFILEQLHSIANQTHRRWFVVASDDGSSDSTPEILTGIQSAWGAQKLRILRGPQAGFARNFLSLACEPDIEADYYAFCDQDDVWEADKLSSAVDWLQALPKDLPALYSGRSRLVDARNADIGLSTLFERSPSFSNALVQCIAGGNTMVFNNAAKKLLQIAGPEVDVVSHDWWAYLAVSACGGLVHYDAHPTVRYRQHGGNIVGTNLGLLPTVNRVKMLLNGRLINFTDRNLRALSKLNHCITPRNLETLAVFAAIREKPLLRRLSIYLMHGIRRQTLVGNLGLVLAVILKKL